MNDQQAVLLWYLHLLPDGSHAVVASSPEWLDTAKGETLDDAVRVGELVRCGATFEELMLRFWLENTIWYALANKRRLTKEQDAYVRAARSARASV